jgi:hypothetical protein
MKPSNEPNQTPSEFEKLLAGLARQSIDFAVVGGLAAMKEILAREAKQP